MITESKTNSFFTHDTEDKSKGYSFVSLKDINAINIKDWSKYNNFKILIETETNSIGLKYHSKDSRLVLFTPNLTYFPKQYGLIEDLNSYIRAYAENYLSYDEEQYYLNDVMEILSGASADTLKDLVESIRDMGGNILKIVKRARESNDSSLFEELNILDILDSQLIIDSSAEAENRGAAAAGQSGGSFKVSDLFKTLQFYEQSIIFDPEEKLISYDKLYLKMNFILQVIMNLIYFYIC